ncbi:MAG: triose-phosphate isomerase [Bacteroidia bacterium]|nr:triose-phosphate isomerase [Bacteroidia bacterium]
MSRKKIVAGNWKMNKSLQEAKALVEQITNQINDSIAIGIDEVTKIIIPPFPYLDAINTQILNKPNFNVGAQNCHTNAAGAFTGEVSASMLSSVGCKYVLVGHSERRQYFKEKDSDFVLKIKEALNNNIHPIFCIGETIDQRKTENHFKVITEQLTNVLKEFTVAEFSKFILAYEPVWAIGTGETATAAQAQEMHAFIRSIVTDLYDSKIANDVSILYGGSCNAQNAQELFSCPDVDGGLIGGASLKADDFCKIILSF